MLLPISTLDHKVPNVLLESMDYFLPGRPSKKKRFCIVSCQSCHAWDLGRSGLRWYISTCLIRVDVYNVLTDGVALTSHEAKKKNFDLFLLN